ncbi:MAG: amidase [Hyphomicrobiales bacterium]|nr:amidase [Hyphomicrobiales bacterium]
MNATIETLRSELDSGAVTSRALVETCIERATAASGEGSRTFITLLADAARAEADAFDGRRRAGIAAGVLGGIPISVKDLFDIRGLPTTGGSAVLADAPAAADDALVVQRLRAAGAVVIGRTNMTEFAFSALGLNPHYGTPANPFDRSSRRIPGGSSSGAAISISDGMAFGAIGTDTGGSVRIPAAFCGLTGFKPTAARVPLQGVMPLSKTLDSIGPLGRSVSCCRALDAVLSAGRSDPPRPVDVRGLRIAVPTTRVLDDMDPQVAQAFEDGLRVLADAGAQISRIAVPEFTDVAETGRVAAFPAAEGFEWHRELIKRARDRYDPRVAERLERGGEVSAADYLWLVRRREQLIAAMRLRAAPFDVLAMPTVPIVAPLIADLETDAERFHRINLLALRNAALINFLDGCALSLPCHREGDAPVGLTLARFDQADDVVLAIGEAVETLLADIREPGRRGRTSSGSAHDDRGSATQRRAR